MKPQEKLLFIKLIHTLVWVIFVMIIGYILWSGITGNISIYSWLSVAAVALEGLVLLLFKGSCPLTGVARKYTDDERDNFDIFLPRWLAKYNKLIFGTLYVFGIVLLLYQTLQ